jgi:acyl-CoA synthetase (AMP-forming)/AMP-acid ligase II
MISRLSRFPLHGSKSLKNFASVRFYQTQTKTARQETREEQNVYSYLKGDEFKGVNQTLGHFMTQQSNKIPYANALRSYHQRTLYPYSALKNHADGMGRALIELGVKPGDRIGFTAGTNVEHVVATLAAAKIGAILVEFRDVKKPKDFIRHMELFRPKILMLQAFRENVDYWKMLKYDLIPELQHAERGRRLKPKNFPYCRHIIFTERDMPPKDGTNLFKECFVYGPFGFYEDPLRRVSFHFNADDPALILLDNPDVNKAKAVAYSHNNLINIGKLMGEVADIRQGDRVMIPGYLNTAFGAILGNFGTLVNGGVIVYPQDEWVADATLGLLEQEHCTHLFASTPHYVELLNHPNLKSYDYSKLRVAVVDSGANEELISKIKSEFGCEVVQIFGTYEAPLIEANGKIVPGLEVKITRKDGKIVHRNTIGDVKLRGSTVAVGTWNDIGFMKDKVDEDGWLNAEWKAQLNSEGKFIV